jgi:glutaredoxin
MVPDVTLYTRVNCCLCEDAKRAIAEAGRRRAFAYREVDVDSDAGLARLYGDEVPVILVNGKKAFKYRVTAEELLKKLAARE